MIDLGEVERESRQDYERRKHIVSLDEDLQEAPADEGFFLPVMLITFIVGLGVGVVALILMGASFPV